LYSRSPAAPWRPRSSAWARFLTTPRTTVGVGKLTYVQTNRVLTNPDPAGGSTVTAQCPSSFKVLGGGIKAQNPGDDADDDTIFDSYPTTTGWAGHVLAGGAWHQPHVHRHRDLREFAGGRQGTAELVKVIDAALRRGRHTA
jgi:hypothetical protein